MKTACLDTIRVSTVDNNPIQDIVNFATIDKSKRNTHPVALPEQLGDVVHADILYGSKTAKYGIK